MSDFYTFHLPNYRHSVVNSSAHVKTAAAPEYLLAFISARMADFLVGRQEGNYFTHLHSARLSWPGDREGGNYLSHFLGQRIIECEEYDHLNASFLAKISIFSHFEFAQ